MRLHQPGADGLRLLQVRGDRGAGGAHDPHHLLAHCIPPVYRFRGRTPAASIGRDADHPAAAAKRCLRGEETFGSALRYNELSTADMCGAGGFAQREGMAMNEMTESGSPQESAETRQAEVDALLMRVRETVARTREVIAATQERLGPAPGAPDDGAAAA